MRLRTGIPFEGNYSSWLEAKQTRLAGEKREQASLTRSINQELDWVRSNAKGQQKKGKARMRRYEDLVNEVSLLNPPSPPPPSQIIFRMSLQRQ